MSNKKIVISWLWANGCWCTFVSGDNGTIDGQGALWWEKFHKGELKYTRPYLIEIMYSENVEISSLTLVNSPSWNVHPVYSRFSSPSLSTYTLHFTWFCFVFRVKCIIYMWVSRSRLVISGGVKLSKKFYTILPL